MKFLAGLATLLFALSIGSVFAGSPGGAVDPDPEYDRLDGAGKSGKKVDVVEWEGNLEIHVYPKGSLKGLALKLDDRNKQKPVLVIGYRFDNAPQTQLIRRNILSIPLRDGFKTYLDREEMEFDKVIVSNNGLSGQVVAYRLDPPPTQLYPEGHPANSPAVADSAKQPKAPTERVPAGAMSEGRESVPRQTLDEDSGTIRSSWTERKSQL